MVTFNTIPSDLLQPLFYAEVDESRAGTGLAARPSLLLGQKLPSGTATADAIVQVTSASQANTLFGVGSHIARMCAFYLARDPYAVLYACPQDDAAGTASTGTLAIVDAATSDGTLNLYIGGQLLAVPVVSGDSITDVGDAVEAALGANESAAVALGSEYPVTAVNAAGTVTFTARNKGTLGDKIDLRLDYLGAAGGEESEASTGQTYTITAMGVISGATDPTTAAAIVSMGDDRYSFVGYSYALSAEMDRLQTEFDDASGGRWGPFRKLYGHCFTADVDTYSNLSTTGLATAINNDAHNSAFGIESSPTPPWEIAASYCAAAAGSLRINPALNLNNLELTGVKAPASADRFEYSERDVLLRLGITTPVISSDGKVLIQRAVTTHTETPAGVPSVAFRDVTTPASIDYQLTNMETLLVTKYARHKLVRDTANVDVGQRVVSPSMIAADIIALYKGWERATIVEDADTMTSLLVVEINATDPNRVDVLYPPDIANNLHALAVQAQFRLQYSQAEIEGAQ